MRDDTTTGIKDVETSESTRALVSHVSVGSPIDFIKVALRKYGGASRMKPADLDAMRSPRAFPSPKRWLLDVHIDLAKVTSPVEDYVDADPRLSDFEILVLLLEDRRFFEHHGIDLRSVAREFVRMLLRQPHGGASTIDMQFVRTRTGYKDRTFRRKSYEMLLAYLLQFRMSKLAILRSYLQIVYLGSALRGAESASWTLYKKLVFQLERDESASIAAMMVYPKPLQPTESWERKVRRRADYGLRLFARYAWRYKKRLE